MFAKLVYKNKNTILPATGGITYTADAYLSPAKI